MHTCPRCGYCPHCKRSDEVPMPFRSYTCWRCGRLIGMYEYHTCQGFTAPYSPWVSPSYPPSITWTTTADSNSADYRLEEKP